MWDVAYTATETTSDYEVSRQLAALSREVKLLKAEREQQEQLAALTREVQLLKAKREQEAHRDWTYQPEWSSGVAYTEPEEGYAWNQCPNQGVEPYWQDNQGDMWNQDQGQGYYYPDWQEDPNFAWNQDQGHDYQQEDLSFAWNQNHEQKFQPDWCDYPSFQDQWQSPVPTPQFNHPPAPPPQGPTLEESLNASILATKRSKKNMEAMCERIDAHYEQITWCLDELMQQSLAKESPKQPTCDDEDDIVNTYVVTTSERSMDVDDNDDEGTLEPDASNVAVELVEPIMVEDADELCYPDLTDEQWKREEYTPVFGLPELTADFFSFQYFYIIPSASYFKNCSILVFADLTVHCCFLQDVGEDCLLVGPADVLEEDERIQVMEWLKLQKEFG